MPPRLISRTSLTHPDLDTNPSALSRVSYVHFVEAGSADPAEDDIRGKWTGGPVRHGSPSQNAGTTPDGEFTDLRIGSDLWNTGSGHALRSATERLLCAAGIGGGMHVLDLHCGRGDLTFTVADRVGPTGRVLGVDPRADAVELARSHSAAHGYTNVEFLCARIDQLPAPSSFDAVVCRHVLTGQRDPVGFLRLASGFVRSRGVLALHEMDLSRGVRSVPPVPELRLVNEATRRVLERLGILPDVGGRLVDLFDEADLNPPILFAQSLVSSGLDRQVFSLITSVMRSLLPYLTADETAGIDVSTLENRLRLSASQLRSQVEFIPQVCGWVRVDRDDTTECGKADDFRRPEGQP